MLRDDGVDVVQQVVIGDMGIADGQALIIDNALDRHIRDIAERRGLHRPITHGTDLSSCSPRNLRVS